MIFFRNPAMLLTSLAVSVLTTGCGESKSVQCQKVGSVINKTTTQLQATSSLSPKESMLKGAELSEQAAKELDTAQVQDAKLKDLTTRLAGAYRNISQSSRNLSNAMDAQGVVSDPSISQANLQVQQQANLTFNELNTYCSGG